MPDGCRRGSTAQMTSANTPKRNPRIPQPITFRFLRSAIIAVTTPNAT